MCPQISFGKNKVETYVPYASKFVIIWILGFNPRVDGSRSNYQSLGLTLYGMYYF